MAKPLHKPAGLCTTAKPLERGRACLNCRFLKIRCDGKKPICGPCRRKPEGDECEYDGSHRRSRAKQLEETVSHLECRIRELEHVDELSPSFTLFDPYDPYNRMIQLSEPLPCAEEPLFPFIQSLLDNFLPHCTQFGFFLNVPCFRDAAVLPLPFGHPSRPSTSVLSAVYLWGVHMSHSASLITQERDIMTMALQNTATDPLSAHPSKDLHTLQAEVLISYYLLRVGRLLEAKTHAAAALSLALGCRLHTIRPSSPYDLSASSLLSDNTRYPPWRSIEEDERINGFWAVFTLHKYIAVASEIPLNLRKASIGSGTQIDAQWACDCLSYVDYLNIPESSSPWLLPPYSTSNQPSTLYLNVKASILFQRAVNLAGKWTPNPPITELLSLNAAFQSIRYILDAFQHYLPRLNGLDPSDPSSRIIILTHALVDAATIKLHSTHFHVDPIARHRCLTAAHNIVTCEGLNLQDFGYMNPIMSTLWVSACQVFVDEITSLRSTASLSDQRAEGEQEILEKLCKAISTMKLFLAKSIPVDVVSL